MRTELEIRADVLSMKLRGLSPRAIADELELSVAQVMRHDRAITKMMKNGDEEQLSKMSEDELKFAARAVSTMLPYMEKNLDAIQRQNKTLQTLHVTALEVAENAMNIINTRMSEADLSITDLDRLVTMFTTVYNSLYNKNGIQIVNLLANAGGVTDEQAKVDARKEMMREEIAKQKKLAEIIDAEIED